MSSIVRLDSLALKAEIDLQKNLFLLQILDQTQLPHREVWLTMTSLPQMIEAIQSLRVRGAPLIGVTAALFLAGQALSGESPASLQHITQQLYHARPTAVNLMNCLTAMRSQIDNDASAQTLVDTAITLFKDDVRLCRDIAEHGSQLISNGDHILTHCNTGGLATAGVGTALGILQRAHTEGKKIHVYIDETRPLLQGARLTAWELQKWGIDCTLITDSTAAQLMRQGKIHKAFVGSDRIARNGDFANKIGTYSVAVNCHHHRIPFYVAAPSTTVDRSCLSGDHIPIEQRIAAEVRGAKGYFGDVTWAPDSVAVYNPAFDVTPAELTTAWILETGIYRHKDIEQGVFS
jgi:methylthioribose-1-phosphate isomerase